MVYQTLKYFLARTGLTVLFMVTLGFLALYFLHEIALPQVVVNDKEVQWGLLAICAFLGFIGYGLVGDMRITNGLHKLKHINLEADEHAIRKLFDRLFALTYSSCFLPGKGGRLRRRVIQLYADYLLSMGREDREAMGIYIKAFLQQPQDSIFRAPIVAILAREISMGDSSAGLSDPDVMAVTTATAPPGSRDYSCWSDEIDLLVDMLKLDNYRDEAIVNLLTSLFLKHQEFSLRSEPLFVRAIDHAGVDVEKVVRFVVPFYLRKKRIDSVALKFYLRAWSYEMAGCDEMKKILARAFYEGGWKVTDMELHQQCGQVFQSLNMAEQEAVARSVNEKAVSSTLKKEKLISREDRASLEKIKPRKILAGEVSNAKPLWRSALSLLLGISRVAIASLNSLLGFVWLQDIRIKWALFLALVVMIAIGPVFNYLKERKAHPRPPPQSTQDVQSIQKKTTDSSKVYTVQIAAVFTESQSNKIIKSAESRGVEGLYVVQSQRASGGNWYKVRFGMFPNKEEAQKVAEDLMEKKIIKNYFVLSIARKAE